MIIFTRREIEKAWRNNLSVYDNGLKKTNAHRLMLFYAVECGLKAAIMRRKTKEITDHTITEIGHNINKLLHELRVSHLNLPRQIKLQDIQGQLGQQQRNCQSEEINQIWRYGHLFNKKQDTTDYDLEKKLLKIVEWIEQELAGG